MKSKRIGRYDIGFFVIQKKLFRLMEGQSFSSPYFIENGYTVFVSLARFKARLQPLELIVLPL
ncbi:hypothetical protein C7293_09675 [filamentous cyanobacterium CCT1]|nr:hypothetical protein C7293_09675 [filamentous cyanobacterium CCT1]PSN76428.1 hypothetical protein C8B47_27375 [filamentous cyanobacterium CCP4]